MDPGPQRNARTYKAKFHQPCIVHDFGYRVATGSVSYYWNERAAPNYSGLNWGYDGCSVPQ
ncbi:hypothetical protein CTI14_63510, partial [Methylobacterium radiotolerans]